MPRKQSKKQPNANLSTELEAACPEPEPFLTIGPPGPSNALKVSSWQDSESCNVTNIAMIAQADMTTNIVQDVNAHQQNTIYINTGGNFTCTDCVFDQNNYYNAQVVQASYISNTAQQQLMLSMMQQSSAVSKGLSLVPQNSSASNVMNGYMKAVINMNTNVSQSCESDQSNLMTFQIGQSGDMSGSSFTQTNTTNLKCVQTTVSKNVSIQSLSAQISQAAYASSIGLTVWALIAVFAIVVIGCVADFFVMAYNWAAGLLILGVVIFLVGMCVMFDTVEPTRKNSVVYGFSPGIQNAEVDCRSMYKKDVVAVYPSVDKAMDVLMSKKGKKYAAFDWVWNSDAKGGTAQWYEYVVSGKKITNRMINDKCISIIDSSEDQASNLISMRPDAYLNVSLKGLAPTSTIVADAVLDIDTGNLWVRMPPGFNVCNPTSYGGAVSEVGDSEPWIWVHPKTVNISNVNNAYYRISGCASCGAQNTCCTQGCSEAIVTVKSTDGKSTVPIGPDGEVKNAKIYFYIDPARVMNYNLPTQDGTPSKYNYGMGNYQFFLNNVPSLVANHYGWNYSSPVGNDDMYKNVKDGDYFLVPFPYGPKSSADYFTGTYSGKWPTVASDFEPYDFGQIFTLYKAVKDKDSGKYYPYPENMAVNPPEPLNIVPGLGPSIDVQGGTWTVFKVFERGSKTAAIISACVMGFGFLLMLVAIALLIYTTNNNRKQLLPVEGQEIEMKELAPSAGTGTDIIGTGTGAGTGTELGSGTGAGAGTSSATEAIK